MKAFKNMLWIYIFCIVATVCQAQSKFPVQARLFVAGTQVNPKSLNSAMSDEGLMEYKYLAAFGVEMSYPTLPFIDLGLRYTKHWLQLDEDPISLSTEYYGKLSQDTVAAVLRVPMRLRGMLKFDAFAAFGGSNTVFTMKSASIDGKLTKTKASSRWLATPYYASGVSAGVGYKKFFLFAEAGYESNKVSDFSRTGSIPDIGTIDMSGPYVLIGVLFDGAIATKQ